MIEAATAEQVRDFLDAVEGRPLTVTLSRAHERRLRANITRFNADPFAADDPLDETDDSLAIVLLATSDRGLHDGEADARVWTDAAGRERPLPRVNRAPLSMRVRFALRAARTSWRSS